MKVYLSEIAELKLSKLTEYLVENWNLKTRDDFLDKFTRKIIQISLQPHSCPQSDSKEGLYKCVVTKQTTFYYRISVDLEELEIITIFDTRQDPQKLWSTLE